MSDVGGKHPQGKTARFRAAERTEPASDLQAHAHRDSENLIDELTAMRRRLVNITDRGRDGFFDESDERNYLAAQTIIMNFDDAATRRIPVSVKAALSTVPWEKISGMRNTLAHDYRGTQKEIVWQVITNELPQLLDELLAEGAI